MTPEQFGSHIRQEREAKGVTLRKMAKMLGVSPTYLSMVETGGCSMPTAKRIMDIAEALYLSRDELLARAGMIAPDVVEIILSDPACWAHTIRRMAQERSRLAKRLDGRKHADFSDCGIPHLVEK